MMKTEEHIEHDPVGDVGVVKDDVKEDLNELLEEESVIVTNLTD